MTERVEKMKFLIGQTLQERGLSKASAVCGPESKENSLNSNNFFFQYTYLLNNEIGILNSSQPEFPCLKSYWKARLEIF